jgi:hypothetical protein
MFVDFGMAVQYDGVCYLRFDDTNPEAEKQEYIDHIEVRRQEGGGYPVRCVKFHQQPLGAVGRRRSPILCVGGGASASVGMNLFRWQMLI